jgi:hypothetical protein
MKRRWASSRVSSPSITSATSSRSRLLSPWARQTRSRTSSIPAARTVTAIPAPAPSSRAASTTAHRPSAPRRRTRGGRSGVLAALGIEGFFRSVGRPADGPGLPDRRDVDIPLMKQVSAQFNAETVGPPLGAGE